MRDQEEGPAGSIQVAKWIFFALRIALAAGLTLYSMVRLAVVAKAPKTDAASMMFFLDPIAFGILAVAVWLSLVVEQLFGSRPE